MRVLVTGGAGFIGSHIVERLLARGHLVTVVDDLSAGRREHLPPQVELHTLSIHDGALVDRCAGADVVVHAAAQTSVATSVATPSHDARANVEGTIRTLDAAIRSRVRRFVYISSAAVYGPPVSLPIDEAHPTGPISPYGLSKLAGEQYTRLLAEAAGMPWIALRLANVYGPRQSVKGEAGVIARWCGAISAGEPIRLEGDGTQTRDFLFVQDVADAVVRAAEAPPEYRGVINIGTGTETALTTLLGQIEAACERRATVEQHPPRPGDIRRSVLSNTAALRWLGWRPVHSLTAGLRRTVGWIKQEEGSF